MSILSVTFCCCDQNSLLRQFKGERFWLPVLGFSPSWWGRHDNVVHDIRSVAEAVHIMAEQEGQLWKKEPEAG